MNSLSGTTADQEGTTREKDRKDKVSMFHAALADWEVKPFCRVLQALVSLNQRIGLGLSVQAVASGRLKEKVLPS